MPRRLWRSMNSSVRTPFSMSAARFSRGATLISISVVTPAPSDLSAPHRDAGMAQQFGRFEQRQAHDARVAARDVAHEHGAQTLDRIRARLALRFAALPVGQDHVIGEGCKLDFGGRESILDSVPRA